MPLPELPGRASSWTVHAHCTGTVATFDVDSGLGTVAVSDPDRTVAVSDPDGTSYGFHCTEIADGTRSIEVGTQVAFVVGPAGPGVWEAKQLRSIGRRVVDGS